MQKGLGPTVSRKDLARAIAKNVPMARRKEAFAAAKEFGIKGVKGSYGKLTTTQAKKLTQEIKDRGLFKAEVHARGQTAKHVLTQLVTKPEEAGPTSKEIAATRAEKIKVGGRAMLQDRLREEERKEGKILARASGATKLGEKPANKKEAEAAVGIAAARLTPSQVSRTGGKVVPHDELPPRGGAPGGGSTSPDTSAEVEPQPATEPPQKSASEWSREEETKSTPPSEPPALPI